jgi:hypothetical protein
MSFILRKLRFCAVLSVGLGAASPAGAQRVELMSATQGSSYEGSSASKTTLSPILPARRLEMGGELVFLTADRDLLGEELKFTDVAIMPLHVRMAVSQWLELSAGTGLLIKQSEGMDEPVWQGANGGLRVPFGAHFAASVQLAGGPLMFGRGHFWEQESSLLARFAANEWLRFELRAGHTLTALRYDNGSSTLHELMTHAEVQFGEKEGGGWVGVDYYIPLVSSTRANAFDPNTRINLMVGCVLSPRRTGWDLYLSYGIVDRGSVERPGSTVPILTGGFDQRQFALGVQHRFDLFDRKRKRDNVLAY